MKREDLEKRLQALEQSVKQLQDQVNKVDPDVPWWQKIAGRHADDPVFDEIVRLGREYRESLRPGRKKRSGKKVARGRP